MAKYLLEIDWLRNPWVSPALVIVGLFVIWLSSVFNVWSLRQQAIDDLVEDLSWAIHYLLNRPVQSEPEVAQWEGDLNAWCGRVGSKLGNRAFFTRANQLHFDRLGFVPYAGFAGTYNARHQWLVSQLNLKFERLRNIINWSQMRRR